MDQKQALADRLKQANNILVTVSNNPSVDQLSACIGLTLALNKLGKHATAVFSGAVPSTIEFLQPEKTIEKNTDSLRDFIIALDKSKADKLRYKVEDTVVKIFITPYKTSINEKDLQFSQGDFNVDVVLALGVHNQTDLDQAITSHGRILHDAVVATVNNKPGGELGSINWLEPKASSLSELVVELLDVVDKTLMDGQMATALLTGIVAETERFSNDKTSPTTMTLSAELMAAGANQQLVATKLEPPKPAPTPPPPPSAPVEAKNAADALPPPPPAPDDGTLEILHTGTEAAPSAPSEQTPSEESEDQSSDIAKIHIDDKGTLHSLEGDTPSAPLFQPEPITKPPVSDQPILTPPLNPSAPLSGSGSTDPTQHMETQHMILEPPTMGGQLTASTVPEDEERPAGDPLSMPEPPGLLQRSSTVHPPQQQVPTPLAAPVPPLSPPPQSPASFAPPFPGVTPVAPPSTPPLNVIQPTVPSSPPAPTPPPPPAPVVGPLPSPPPMAGPSQTLSQIEQTVNSPHVAPPVTPSSTSAFTLPSAPSPSSSFMPPAPTPPPSLPVEPVMPSVPASPAPVSPPPAPALPAAPPATDDTDKPDVESARNAVMQALASQPSSSTEPIQALNAQPFGDPLHMSSGAANLGLPVNPSGGSTPPPAGPPPMVPPQPQ
jgi:hypothetical protein